MLNNIKSKHLLEIYRKKAESKKQEERSDQSIFDDTSSTETDYTETIPSNASDVEDFASQYGSYESNSGIFSFISVFIYIITDHNRGQFTADKDRCPISETIV